MTAKFFELAAVRGPEFRSNTWNGLYDDASFPVIAREWAGTARAAAGPLDGDNHAALQLQVLCNDADWPEQVGYYQRAVERERARHPMFGPAAANVNPCAFWPVERAEPPVRVGGRARRTSCWCRTCATRRRRCQGRARRGRRSEPGRGW